MKKVDLGKTIGILANLGVVIGLALVAIEIQQANDQAAASAYQARADQIDVSQQQLALSSDLAGILVKVEQSGLDSLDAVELLRLRAWEFARSTRMASQHYQYRQGYLDEAAHRAMMRNAGRAMNLWVDLGFESEYPEFLGDVRAYRESE